MRSTCVDPIAAFLYRQVRPTDDILQHSAILLDRSNRSDVAIVAGHENPLYSQLVSRDLYGVPKDLRRKAAPTEFRYNRIPDMATGPFQKRIQRMSYRSPADDSPLNEREEKCGGNLSRGEGGNTRLRDENVKGPPERHSFAVVMKDVRNLRRRRAVGSEKLAFLVLSG